MIEAKTDKGKTHICIEGTIQELEADLCLICRGITLAITEENDKDGLEFKHFIEEELGCVFNKDVTSDIKNMLKDKTMTDLFDLFAECLEALYNNENQH